MSNWTRTNGSDFQSGNIDSFSYDGGAKTLTVKFTRGDTYTYKNVDEATANSLDKADSKTTFLNESLKGRFEFDKG